MLTYNISKRSLINMEDGMFSSKWKNRISVTETDIYFKVEYGARFFWSDEKEVSYFSVSDQSISWITNVVNYAVDVKEVPRRIRLLNNITCKDTKRSFTMFEYYFDHWREKQQNKAEVKTSMEVAKTLDFTYVDSEGNTINFRDMPRYEMYIKYIANRIIPYRFIRIDRIPQDWELQKLNRA